MNIADRYYEQVKNVAMHKGLEQTVKILPYVREKHDGCFRKGKSHTPYVVHPLNMALHAMALGLYEDDLITTILLHDVCEDCDVPVEELPVNDIVRKNVDLLTKRPSFCRMRDNQAYYEAIAGERIASLVKMFDRCNNISTMSEAFSKEKMQRYIRETEEFLFPLFEKNIERFPEMTGTLCAIRYHLSSVMSTVLNMIDRF